MDILAGGAIRLFFFYFIFYFFFHLFIFVSLLNSHHSLDKSDPGPEVTKLFPCSTRMKMKIFQLINVKMPTIVGILTFMCGKNSIFCLSEPEKSRIS